MDFFKTFENKKKEKKTTTKKKEKKQEKKEMGVIWLIVLVK